jgi:hypothetical protein
MKFPTLESGATTISHLGMIGRTLELVQTFVVAHVSTHEAMDEEALTWNSLGVQEIICNPNQCYQNR